MDPDSYSEEQFDILETVIEGIHSARVRHPILATIATKADSVLLANAALNALDAAGFRIIREENVRKDA